MKHYSQNDEQQHVMRCFAGRPPAAFLDIGAFGDDLSNTRALLESGWSGLYVEADPFAFCRLYESTQAHRDRATLLLGTLWPNRGVGDFHVSPSSGLSTTSGAHRQKWSTYPTVDYRKIITARASYEDLAAQVSPDTQMVSIDVESESVAVFEGLADMLAGLRSLRMVIVEHDLMLDRCEDVAERLGLSQVAINAENLIYVKVPS